mmetsp:Transcript_33606/g.51758  ORF Transcript_33606/g.51758 Transcript_33606/m.51758 type:complete len:100 (+) Transcript_33606:1543-1842(+)
MEGYDTELGMSSDGKLVQADTRYEQPASHVETLSAGFNGRLNQNLILEDFDNSQSFDRANLSAQKIGKTGKTGQFLNSFARLTTGLTSSVNNPKSRGQF